MRKFFISAIIILAALSGGYYYFYNSQGLIGKNFLVKGIISVTSPNFPNNGFILKKYSCDGMNINPTIDIERVPGDAKSLVLIVVDKTSIDKSYTHWLVYNIEPDVNRIEEDSIPKGGQVAFNDFGKRQYDGPCPSFESHTYSFRVYALDTILTTESNTDRSQLDKLIKGHIIAKGELLGEYIKN